MVMIFLVSGFCNPSLAINILLPEPTTYQLSGHIYQVHLENSFQKATITPGIFFEGFYKKHYPAADDYFRNSGEPFTTLAGGAGINVTFSLIDHIQVSYGAGYFIGHFAYPAVLDSGAIVIQHDERHSIGVNGALATFHRYKKIKAGIRVCLNIIPFGAQEQTSGSNWQIPPHLHQASLVSFGAGLQVGMEP